jgi:hypothetical protein
MFDLQASLAVVSAALFLMTPFYLSFERATPRPRGSRPKVSGTLSLLLACAFFKVFMFAHAFAWRVYAIVGCTKLERSRAEGQLRRSAKGVGGASQLSTARPPQRAARAHP